MDTKEQLEYAKKLLVIKESLVDYAGPIFIFGNVDWLFDNQNATVISATMPREEFAILNNNVPKWVDEVNLKANDKNNILVIRDIDKISLERQEILLDILEDNQISTEDLPENLKIILNASNKCDINVKVRDIVECYEL